MTLASTPSQTVGPFFSIGMTWPGGNLVVPEDTPGAITVHGRLLDGAGDPIPDGVIETWQADPDGRFAHPDDPRGPAERAAFTGFARCGTQPDGTWRIVTLKPGPLPTAEDDREAPHLNVTVLCRGLLHRVVTRIYFSDETEANAADPVLSTVDPARRDTLIAVADGSGYRLDIKLQGENETVFFEL